MSAFASLVCLAADLERKGYSLPLADSYSDMDFGVGFGYISAMSKGKPELPGKGTKTQKLYREWLTAGKEIRALIANSLTNICVSNCRGLCPPVEHISPGDNYREWRGRWGARWKWCHAFVLADLPKAEDECRYIARRCRFRLIDAIDAFHRMPRATYLSTVKRDGKGRFLKRKKKVQEPEHIAPVKILYRKPGRA
jgi:hypothetical protein